MKPLILTLALGLMITGCSSIKKSGSSTSTEDIDNQGSYAQGLGDESGFSASGMDDQDLKNTNCEQAPVKQVYHFDFDSDQIKSIDEPCISAQARYLSENPNQRVWLLGHTDEQGSPEYNIALGERRAQTVLARLTSLGVESHQVSVISYGQEKPVAAGHDESTHRLNRRVEIQYHKPGRSG